MDNYNDGGFDAIFDDVEVTEESAEEEVEETEDVEETEETMDDEDESVEEEEPVQSDEENAKYAAARRKAERERDDAVARAREEAAAEWAESLKTIGLVNPYTGEPLQSIEDLKAYGTVIAEEQRAAAERQLKESGLSDEQIDRLVQAHPAVRKAQEEQKRLAVLDEKVQMERGKQVLEQEMEKIREFDPGVKSYDDILNNEHFDEFERLVKERGYTISDAYFIVNRDALIQRQVAAAKQETMNVARGKDHLEKTASRGDGGIAIPADVLNNFKEINPNASNEEIRKFYERDLKRMKKRG